MHLCNGFDISMHTQSTILFCFQYSSKGTWHLLQLALLCFVNPFTDISVRVFFIQKYYLSVIDLFQKRLNAKKLKSTLISRKMH